MSMAAEYHANLWLKTNPSVEEIRAKIKSLHEYSEWAYRNMGPGMDGSARTIHMNGTEIRVYEAHLAKLEKEAAAIPAQVQFIEWAMGSN